MKSNHALHEAAVPLFGGLIADYNDSLRPAHKPSPPMPALVGPPQVAGFPKPPAHSSDSTYAEISQTRSRQRVMNFGAATISDSELLELALGRVLSPEDAAQLVEILMNELGDYNRVISASTSRLRSIARLSDEVICELKLIEASAHRLARGRVLNRPVISGWDALLDYCHTAMAHQPTERIRVLYMDRKNTLIADEEQGNGTVNHAPIYTREVVRRALELEASSLILVHNHPSGDPTPSQADIETTDRIALALSTVDITLHDHLVLGQGTEISFRAQGLL